MNSLKWWIFFSWPSTTSITPKDWYSV